MTNERDRRIKQGRFFICRENGEYIKLYRLKKIESGGGNDMLVKEMAQIAADARIVCGKENMQDSEETLVSGLCADTSFLKKGDAFFCIEGKNVDSHELAYIAEERGASVVVCEKELELSVPQIVVNDTRLAMALIAKAFYGNACDRLKIIGIVGTNGKTTTAHMLASVLRRAGKNTGVIGTLGIFYGRKKIAPELTTPDPIFLHSVFADMVACGVEYAVTEVSAHALYYKKDAGISYAACIFTNLSRDHLDFFSSVKEYKRAKAKAFTEERCSVAILNGDDAFAREIGKSRKGAKTLWYALESPADTFAIVTEEGLNGSASVFNLSDMLCRVSLSLLGRHNVYNAMAAASCARFFGIGAEAIENGLKTLKKVDGRMERAGSFRGADIFVDYAHTPDGLEKALSALKTYCKGKLFCVFGCGGNRDEGKREPMGEIAAKKTDFSVITSDNPRFEDPSDIIVAIERGYRRFSEKYVAIPDRKDAVYYALSLLNDGDVLLIAGKGAEDTQEIMGIKHAYNDKTTVKEAVRRLSIG